MEEPQDQQKPALSAEEIKPQVEIIFDEWKDNPLDNCDDTACNKIISIIDQQTASLRKELEKANKSLDRIMENRHELLEQLSEKDREIDLYRQALLKIKPLYDGRKNEYERIINEALNYTK